MRRGEGRVSSFALFFRLYRIKQEVCVSHPHISKHKTDSKHHTLPPSFPPSKRTLSISSIYTIPLWALSRSCPASK